MEARNDAIKKFKKFASRDKSTKIKDQQFTAALEPLVGAVDSGFNIEEINTLVSALVTLPLTLRNFSSLLRVIVPASTVSNQAIEDLVLWAYKNHRTQQTCAILTLQWVTVAVELELASKENLNEFYELFFAMLIFSSMERDAAKLVHLLTAPEDVTRWRVNRVLTLHEKNSGKPHTNALLQRFKAFRPELIPETVAARSQAKAFKRPSALFTDKMAAAAARGGPAQRGAAGAVEWGAEPTTKRRGLGWRDAFIPVPITLRLGSKHRRLHQEASTVQDFRTLETVACHQLTLALPCQAMSLLANEAGLHLLTFGSDSLKHRFSDTLLPKLSELLRFVPAERAHAGAMLSRLAALQDKTQQGLPVVAKAVVNFLPSWNGSDLRDEVWRLVERCSFSSSVLLDLVFPHVRRLFLQSDESGRCRIVRSLTRLVENQFESCWRHRSALRAPFPCAPPSAKSLALTTRFVGALCADGLTNAKRRFAALLDASLDFYHTVSLYEGESSEPMWTVMSPAVFYRAILGTNLYALRSALRILIRYMTLDRKRLAKLGVAADFKAEADTVARFAADAANCLWDGKALSNRQTGFLFARSDPSELLAVGTQTELDQAFAPANNLAFAPFLESDEDWEEQVDEIAPELRRLVLASRK